MKKSKVMFGLLAIIVVMSLVTGCGSTEKPIAQPPVSQQSVGGHDGHTMTMPKEDPVPMMKDMDKSLQDMVKQVKAGQTMDAQKSAVQLVSNMEKIMPHMMDAGLKDNLRNTALDIKANVNSGKTDPSVIEGKAKVMQEIMKQTTTHLQTMSH